MKKNLVFVHLESLNQAIFSHRHWFPCLNAIYGRSLRLNNFISSATSSIMALGDILHGDDNVLEHNVALEQGISATRQSPALFDQLKQQGYRTSGLGYPKNWANVDTVWSDHQQFHWHDTPAQMLVEAESIVADKQQPFALYLWNLSSHLCYADAIKCSGKHSFERWQRGYKSLDATVGAIFQLLLKHQQLENTLIIGFGDHGDDFWNHGFNGGFAHAIEPYTSLVHTPAFIFDASQPARDINHLVSAIDLKNTALELLNLPGDDNTISPTFSALSPGRPHCFSRNLFINQPGNEDGSPLNKGYAITSEFFHLLSVQGKYQMFAWQADSGNHFDLLALLVDDGNGDKRIDFERLGAARSAGAHPHIQHFLAAGSEKVIETHFRSLRRSLENWQETKRQAVLRSVNCGMQR